MYACPADAGRLLKETWLALADADCWVHFPALPRGPGGGLGESGGVGKSRFLLWVSNRDRGPGGEIGDGLCLFALGGGETVLPRSGERELFLSGRRGARGWGAPIS